MRCASYRTAQDHDQTGWRGEAEKGQEAQAVCFMSQFQSDRTSMEKVYQVELWKYGMGR